ncbi:hypothetical protein [Methylobacterium sp. J-068]|uniref:hypothetical protein n=1 Tax=Methylobacterium sp. J-068 TaxID=2836649 RepID=UPI001FB9E95A|nr:hypothetical protein [Methylobacterium sp. J-068]MCJ2037135.1 hypothetical protein [Methylobacterium sp. J-068]
MAHETAMKSVSAACAQMPSDPWSSLTVLSDQRMLSALGGNLRDVYADVTDSAQPSDLLRLAAMIDEQRSRSNG